MTIDDARAMTLALIARRAAEATVCPSEVARSLAAAARAGPSAVEWRAVMPIVHDAIDALVATGDVRLSWKGRSLPERAGPYRIGRPIAAPALPR